MTDVDPRWFESFFETDEWLLVAGSVEAERTERQVAFLAEHVPAGARVLDLACGTGRIAVPLAVRGYDVAGLDISRRALGVAREAGSELDLRHGDMRRLPWPDGSFDAVVNLWTAFGYFATQADDEAVLAEVARVLVPDGVFVIDTVNPAALFRRFQPEHWEELADGTFLLTRLSHDLRTGRSAAAWTFVRPDGTRVVRSFEHRLYTAAEYGGLLRGAGLEPEKWFGGFDGAELSLDSWRLIVVARRPG